MDDTVYPFFGKLIRVFSSVKNIIEELWQKKRHIGGGGGVDVTRPFNYGITYYIVCNLNDKIKTPFS